MSSCLTAIRKLGIVGVFFLVISALGVAVGIFLGFNWELGLQIRKIFGFVVLMVLLTALPLVVIFKPGWIGLSRGLGEKPDE